MEGKYLLGGFFLVIYEIFFYIFELKLGFASETEMLQINCH